MRRYTKRLNFRILFAIILFMGILLVLSTTGTAGTNDSDNKYFNSLSYSKVFVSKGDTLDKITTRYNNSKLDRKTYIKTVMEINNLNTATDLRAGEYLVVPVEINEKRVAMR